MNDIIALLASAYDLQLASIHPLSGTGDKQLYNLEDVHGRKLMLRVYPPAQKEVVVALLHVLLFLEQQAYPAERVITGIHDTCAVAEHGDILVVTTFIKGNSADFSPTTLYKVGAQLARLHALNTRTAEHMGHTLPVAQMLPARELTYALSQLTSIAQDVPEEYKPRYDMLAQAVQSIASYEHLPTVLIHNDCHLANAIQAPSGQVVFIDWEGAGLGPAVIDLGFLLVSSDTASLWTPALASDPQRIPAIIDGYCQHHRLTSAELDYLPDAIRFRSLIYGACSFAEAIRQHTREDAEQWWWLRYQAADGIAERAREHIHCQGEVFSRRYATR